MSSASPKTSSPHRRPRTASLGNDGRLVGTYFGVYYLSLGIGGAAGNLLIGTSFDFAQATGLQALPGVLLALIGALSAVMVLTLERCGIFSRAGWSLDTKQVSYVEALRDVLPAAQAAETRVQR
jgi:hypothetical protein